MNEADNKVSAYKLTLNPPVAGPNLLTTTLTLTATLTRHGVTPVAATPVNFEIIGDVGTPVLTYTQTTNSLGQAVISYTRTLTNNDQIIARTALEGFDVESNPAYAYWLTPKNDVSESMVHGTFFAQPSPASGAFSATKDSIPLFTQDFTGLRFNNLQGTFGPSDYCGYAWEVGVPINPCTVPFSHANYDVNGTPIGIDIAQGNGYRAREGSLTEFNAVFTGTLVVNKSGWVTFKFYHDDGMVFGVGSNQNGVAPSADSTNTQEDWPASGRTAFRDFPIMAGKNNGTTYQYDVDYELHNKPSIAKIYFPEPGLYPYEINYSQYTPAYFASLTTQVEGTNVTNLLQVGSLKITPNSTLTSQPADNQTPVTFTVQALNPDGQPAPNLIVTLSGHGANTQDWQGTTDSNGIVTFTNYVGKRSGEDRVQAFAWIKGQPAVSQNVLVQWTGGTDPVAGCNNPLVPTSWLTPANRTNLTGSVPLTLARAVNSASITYWPVRDPNYIPQASEVATLPLAGGATSFSAGSKIADFDTTLLANGSYIIRICGTDPAASNAAFGSLHLVTVVGENKPGRVAFDVTDFTVPVAGMPIVVGRTYDSLERGTSGDFGFGWNLSISSPKLEVNPAGDVTLTTLDGKRVTFFFTPGSSVFGFGEPAYTAEAGVYGTLTSNGCGAVAAAGSAGGYLCFPGGRYEPNSYSYRDAYGRVYNISRASASAPFKLTSLTDLTGNTLSFTDNGIKASNLTGSVSSSNIVTFTRDGAGRITAITGPDGKVYSYSYAPTDTTGLNAGDLEKVTLPQFMPGTSTNISLTYSYHTTQTSTTDYRHLFLAAKDPRGNTAATTLYDGNGRLAKVTDATGKSFDYSYEFLATPDAAGATNRTTVTNPDSGGESKTWFDSYGKVLTETNPLNESTGYRYDSSRNKVSEANALGQTTSFGYNNRGQQDVITNSLGYSRTTQYNYYGGPLTMTNEEGEATGVGYDANFMPTSVADQAGKPLGGYEFDSRGSVLTRLDGNGKRTGFGYDQYGNKVSETDPLGNASLYAYDLMGRVVLMTDTVGTVTKFTYDGLGRQTQAMYAFGTPRQTQVSYEYDSNGNKISETDNASRKTSYTYDAANRVTRIDYPDGTRQEYVYNWQNNKVSDKFFDKAGQLFRHTQMSYDNAGRLITTTQAASWLNEAVTVARVYDAAGRLISETNPYAGTGYSPTAPGIRYTYDGAGRLVNLKNQLGVSSVYTYDKSGRKTAQTDAVGTSAAYTLRFGYDIRGRQTVITYPNGTTAKSTFDDAGNQLTKIDQGGFTTSYGYDPLNRLLSVTNPASEKVSYRYDAAGRLKAIVDAKTHETGFDYDELGRVTKKTLASGSFEQFGYDNVTGNKTSHRLADGNTNTFKYDLMNRVSEVKYYDIATAYLVTYTANGLRSQVSDDRGLTSYSYNHRDLLTSYVQPVKDGSNFFSQRVDYTYNAAGNRSSVETFMGASGVPSTSVSYGYNAGYQLTTVTQSGVATATTYAYDDLGRRTNTALSNGANVKYEYAATAPNQLLAVKHFWTGLNPNVATPSVSYAYFYTSTNPFGNANLRTGLTESKNGAVTANYTWDYDAAFRVSTETLQAGSTITTTGFGYDGAGNRTEWRQKVGADATTSVTYQYDELDRLLSTNNGASGGEVYSYNPRGNLIQIKQNGTVQKSFTWDGADRLTSVQASGGVSLATFKYDFDGRRIQQQITTTTATHSLWDITTRYGDVLLETSYSGNTPNAKVSYTYGQGCGSCSRNPVAELISQKKGASSPEYFLLDGQGSVRGLTNNNGTLVTGSEFSYDTFGKPVGSADLTKSSYLYTGQQYDSVSELYSLRARYYNPQQGRFLSQDTWPVDYYNPLEVNRYSYTAANPVNYHDFSGHTFAEFITNIGTFIIAAATLSYLAHFTFTILSFLIANVMVSWGIITNNNHCYKGAYYAYCSYILENKQVGELVALLDAISGVYTGFAATSLLAVLGNWAVTLSAAGWVVAFMGWAIGNNATNIKKIYTDGKRLQITFSAFGQGTIDFTGVN